MSIPSAKTYAWWLALLRIYVGLFWLSRAYPKFKDPNGFLGANGTLGTELTRALAATTGPYHTFLLTSIQPHIAIYAQLLRYGEAVAGALLLLGLFTRLGGLIGIILGIIGLISGGSTIFNGWSSLEAAAIALSAVSLVLPTGRALGIDALFKRGDGDTYDDTPVAVPPSRPAPQPTSNTIDTSPVDSSSRGGAIAPQQEPGPNGANGGPAFAAPASAGPRIDQTSRQSV
ncbi:MAG: TQO small subunit DoxD [Candidatus Tyrphobacter sp.]